MTYQFVCPKCGKSYALQIRISEYRADGHFCECGEELVRDPKDFCTSYSAKTDGFYAQYPSN